MEVTGKIKWIDETKTYGNNGFRKREVVITTEEQYPQQILIEFIQDKCELLNTYQVGQDVKIGINLRGREWTNPEGETKYFNSIQGWRIDALENDSSTEIPPMPPPASFEQAEGRNGRAVADFIGMESDHRKITTIAWYKNHLFNKMMITDRGFPIVNNDGIDDYDLKTLKEKFPYDKEKKQWVKKEKYPKILNKDLRRNYD